MKYSILIYSLSTVLLIFTSSLLANEDAEKPFKGPTLTDYGPTFAIDDRDVQLPKDFVYKAVFDITNTPEDKAKHNRSIESIARFINMHTRNDVELGNLKLAAVFHGKATTNTLNDQAYKKRFGIDNPSTKLIKQLSDLGVEFYLCGQSASFGGVSKEELSPQIKLGLSAMTMHVLLQDEGYKLIP